MLGPSPRSGLADSHADEQVFPMRKHAAIIAWIVLVSAPAGAVTHTISPWTIALNGVEINAAVGDVVDWPSVVGHTVDYIPTLDGQDLDVVNDAASICVDQLSSIRIDSGGSASVTLTTPGVFYYYCTVFFPAHCTSGMRVRVNVADPATPAPVEIEVGAWGRVKALYR